jgi:hypothetical protein
MQKPHNPVSKIMRSILPSAFAGLDASASPDTQGLFYQNHLPYARSGFGVSRPNRAKLIPSFSGFCRESSNGWYGVARSCPSPRGLQGVVGKQQEGVGSNG